MSLKIPLRNDLPFYAFEVELDRRSYGFEVQWNTVEEGWFMSLSDSSGNVLLSSLRVLVNCPLGGRFVDSRLPPGMLMCFDTSNKALDPTREDLGTRVQLVYFTAAEVAV